MLLFLKSFIIYIILNKDKNKLLLFHNYYNEKKTKSVY